MARSPDGEVRFAAAAADLTDILVDGVTIYLPAQTVYRVVVRVGGEGGLDGWAMAGRSARVVGADGEDGGGALGGRTVQLLGGAGGALAQGTTAGPYNRSPFLCST
jgi:hypothetical protein